MKYVKAMFSVFAILLIAVVVIGCNANPTASADDDPVVIAGKGPAPISLGTAENFTVLAKSAITTTGVTSIIGDMGISPAADSMITGFGLIMDATNTFSRSSLITGKVYASNYYSFVTPSGVTMAISDMQTAYTDGTGRLLPDFIELGAGDIGGMILVPGLYKWSTNVTIPSDVTLNGGPDDVWIFQISGTLSVASGKKVLLTGGVQPKNIFWLVSNSVALNTTSHLEGIVSSLTAITMTAGSTVNGRLFAQTAVTLNANTVTNP